NRSLHDALPIYGVIQKETVWNGEYGLPHVAGLADPDTGFIVINITGSELEVMGGTSAAAPLWAALIARINEGLGVRVGYFNPLLYNRLSGVLRAGIGSPDGASLLRALRTGVVFSPPNT